LCRKNVPLKTLVDLVLKVRAQAYSLEAANPRHEHEWQVWKEVKLPEGKILIPGVVTHSTNVVEHPELVAWRIKNFAGLVGRENVIAGTDCGFSQSYNGAWASKRAVGQAQIVGRGSPDRVQGAVGTLVLTLGAARATGLFHDMLVTSRDGQHGGRARANSSMLSRRRIWHGRRISPDCWRSCLFAPIRSH
jgi:hypothetical protein